MCWTGSSAPGCTPGRCGPPAGSSSPSTARPSAARRARTRRPRTLVAALAHGIGAVLGQVAVDEKSNEIPAVRDLLKAFANLASAVITIDAMHTQHDTAQVIPGRGADYMMTVKANMPALYEQLKKLPWAAVSSVSAVSTDHGRRVRRTVKVVLAPSWIAFDGGRPGRAAAPHGHEEGQEDRRGRLPHYQRPRRGPGHPGRLGPQPLGDRKPPPLGEGRDLSGRQIPGQDGKRASRDGIIAQPGHQPAAPGRPRQHRRGQPPPRPAADAKAASGCINATLPCPCSTCAWSGCLAGWGT